MCMHIYIYIRVCIYMRHAYEIYDCVFARITLYIDIVHEINIL